MRRLLLLAACALVLALAAPAQAAQLGINGGPILTDGFYGWVAQSDVDRVLSDLQAAGVTRVRVNAFSSDLPFDNYIAAELAAHGMGWDATLTGASPLGTTLYAWQVGALAWARQFVLTYHPAQVEVGNEPDAGAQFGSPTPRQYAHQYVITRAALKQIDPGLPVIPAAMCCSLHYFSRFLHYLPKPRRHLSNGVAFHTYWIPAWQWEKVLNGFGIRHKRLIDNEYGWSTDPTSWGPSLQVADEFTRDFNYHWAICRLEANQRVRLDEPYVWGADIVNAYESVIPTLAEPCT